MLGDSIQLITSTICEQYSTTAAALYTFSYVILFMHAIHNTLTSLIKEYFIMQKIKLIESEKEKQGHCHFVYIQEVPSTTEKQNSELPLKATPEF